MSQTRSRELSGAEFTAVEVYGESFSEVLAEAALIVARQEYRRKPTGPVINDRGAVRITHAEHEDGHQVIIFFEGSRNA